LFQLPRVVTLHEELLVVVRLEHERVHAAERLAYERSHLSEIGRLSEHEPLAGNSKTDRLSGIVNDTERLDTQFLDLKRHTGLKDLMAVNFAEMIGGAPVRKDGEFEAPTENRDPVDMIGVLVGDENRIEGVRIDSEAAEPLLRFRGGETAIDEDTGGTAL
jgi:hypothetical protein